MTETDKLTHAKEHGQAQFDSIVEMVERLHIAEEQAQEGPDETDAARSWIEEDALSVEVRSDWVAPGEFGTARRPLDKMKPAEYRILLCTGGPAVRIIGTLSEYGEPETAHLEVQDWFTPWTLFWPSQHKHTHAEETLLAYARCFWFGE